MRYVDGFVIPVQKKNLEAYFPMAKKAGKIWRKYGALEYRECAGDDLKWKFGTPFLRSARVKAGETVVFSWIRFKSRTHRDRVNARVMKDSRIREICHEKTIPFDIKRVVYV